MLPLCSRLLDTYFSQWNCQSIIIDDVISKISQVANSPSTLLLEYIEIIPNIQVATKEILNKIRQAL